MEFHAELSCKLSLAQVCAIARSAEADAELREELCNCLNSGDRRVGVNALWVMTHFSELGRAWLASRKNELIDALLAETDTSKKRMLLQLIREQEFSRDELRADLLDFCFSKINALSEPYAVRCFSLYVAFDICRHFPELLDELRQHLEMLALQQLSPGLKSALRQTRAKMARLERSRTIDKM